MEGILGEPPGFWLRTFGTEWPIGNAGLHGGSPDVEASNDGWVMTPIIFGKALLVFCGLAAIALLWAEVKLGNDRERE